MYDNVCGAFCNYSSMSNCVLIHVLRFIQLRCHRPLCVLHTSLLYVLYALCRVRCYLKLLHIVTPGSRQYCKLCYDMFNDLLVIIAL